MTRAEVVARLEEISAQPGFVYIFAILVGKELFTDPAELADKNWREHLSFQELTFLLGLLVKRAVTLEVPSAEGTVAAITEIESLFGALHDIYNEPMRSRIHSLVGNKSPDEASPKELQTESLQEVFGSGGVMSEAIHYGASGAYDFQFTSHARTRYENDAHWLRVNKGFAICDVAHIPKNLKRRAELSEIHRIIPKDFSDLCEAALASFCFTASDLAASEDIADAFLQAFALDPGSVNSKFDTPGQYNAAASHPIVRLPDNRFFLPVHFLLAQSLYESPSYWMHGDLEYRSAAARNRGQATEKIAFDLLKPVFGKGLLRNIVVKKAKSRSVTDIDVIGIVGNKAVVFQAKSKRMTELSRQGDVEKLKHDFSLAVQEAYEQGLACREAIPGRNYTLLDESGAAVSLREEIDEVYIMCLTSDDYPALLAQVDSYLKVPPGSPAPLVMNIFDLEIVAHYLQDPFDFTYYVRQRVTLSGYFTASTEMSFLAYHLRLKLFRNPKFDNAYLDDHFAQLIDANYPAKKGDHPHTEATERLRPAWRNEKFERLTREIKDSQEPNLTDAVFLLSDLGSDTADALIDQIEKAKDRCKRLGVSSDFSLVLEGGKSGISFIAKASGDDSFSDLVMMLGKARKYKTKADIWLVLGSVCGSDRMIDMVAYSKSPWKYDSRLETLVQVGLKPGMALDPGGRKIGRNDKCVCGSGKKFKKCCGKP